VDLDQGRNAASKTIDVRKTYAKDRGEIDKQRPKKLRRSGTLKPATLGQKQVETRPTCPSSDSEGNGVSNTFTLAEQFRIWRHVGWDGFNMLAISWDLAIGQEGEERIDGKVRKRQ